MATWDEKLLEKVFFAKINKNGNLGWETPRNALIAYKKNSLKISQQYVGNHLVDNRTHATRWTSWLLNHLEVWEDLL